MVKDDLFIKHVYFKLSIFIVVRKINNNNSELISISASQFHHIILVL